MSYDNLIQRFLDVLGYQITSMPSLARFLESRKINLVLDVGANIGQFGLKIRKRGYRGEIISFEPIPQVAEKLRQIAMRNQPWTVHQVGLGATDGELDLNVSENSVFSSFLQQTDFTRDFDKSSAVAYVIKTRVQRLDNYISQLVGKSVFLKIDVQGLERQVLSGVGECMQSIEGILLELPAKHLYENTWLFEEAVAELRRLGFVIAQVRPVNRIPNDRASIVELDCVFRRA